MSELTRNIKWIAHDCFRIESAVTIYFDPYQIPSGAEKADIILITHSHYDHCSIGDVKKLIKENTTIVCPPDCVSKVTGSVEKGHLKIMTPGSTEKIGDINIEAVPSYNTNKPFHPKENDWLGYVVTVNGKRIYHAGDTDLIPEMSQLKDIDVALLPVSGQFVMTAEEAAEAVKIIKPKVAIPMHYGAGVAGTKEDAERFKKLAGNLC